jgi:hypothetical protein
MVFLRQLPKSDSNEYCCSIDLNLYDSPKCQALATQAAAGRQLKVFDRIVDEAIEVCLCEDNYRAWLPIDKLSQLEPAQAAYVAIAFSRLEIESRLSDIIAFTKAAMAVPNYYLWGGTVAPNYDCSGLIQAAFAASGIWLPRDSYQQEIFTQRVAQDDLLPGDLIFFGTEKVNHVALYLGERRYIHSSGKDMGRNGIAIDLLSTEGDEISQNYYHKLWSFGRVMSSYSSSEENKLIVF